MNFLIFFENFEFFQKFWIFSKLFDFFSKFLNFFKNFRFFQKFWIFWKKNGLFHNFFDFFIKISMTPAIPHCLTYLIKHYVKSRISQKSKSYPNVLLKTYQLPFFDTLNPILPKPFSQRVLVETTKIQNMTEISFLLGVED